MEKEKQEKWEELTTRMFIVISRFLRLIYFIVSAYFWIFMFKWDFKFKEIMEFLFSLILISFFYFSVKNVINILRDKKINF